MNFDDSPQDAVFRSEVRSWLEANAKPRRHARDFLGTGLPEAEQIRLAREWQAKKATAGYAAISWPKELGGLGGTMLQQLIYRQEEAAYRIPFGVCEITLGMCLPTLAAFGSAADKSRYIPAGLSGKEIWCQLFSEPGAGSDLAGIRTSARLDGGSWRISGQKVWTSGAHFSDYGLLLTRTDSTVPKHRGLTMFFIDMKSPGIEVRPIRQMAGEAEFAEVFFTDVLVPDAQRLGAVGEGWKVALTTLMHERLSVGSETGLLTFDAIFDIAREANQLCKSRVIDLLSDWYVADQGLRLMYCRTVTALSRGQIPGPEQSIAKLVGARNAQQMAIFALDLKGQKGLVGCDDIDSEWRAVERTWSWSAAMRIAGGTDEILRNVIAERVLGLPEDIRVDKAVPFNKIPWSTET